MGLANARRTLPTGMHGANSKIRWRRDNGLGLLSRVWSRPLSSSEDVDAAAYKDILDNYMLLTLW